MQADFEKKLKEAELKRYESPSVLDTGIEHDSPDKMVRPSVSDREFTDFTKEYRLCDKKTYDRNIITKVAPQETDKSVIVDLKRIVNDLNMVKTSFYACAKQLGFELAEPHREEDDFQEQKSPNIPEPVYSASQEYRHLLNTFLRFSRDLVAHVNGEEDTRCFKVENGVITANKQDVLKYKLQISDLKERIYTLEKEQSMLQSIYQNHLDSRLQVIDFKDYDSSKMSEFTQDCVYKIKNLHKELMKLQTMFLKNMNSMDDLNYECEVYTRGKEIQPGEISYNNLEFDTSCPQSQFDRFKRNTFNHKSRNEMSSSAEFGIRKSANVNNYTAQLPRSTSISGVNTSRSVYVSPQKRSNSNMHFKNSTESTKTPYILASENVQSTSKPPKFERRCNFPNASIQPKSRNFLQERHNSFDNLNLEKLNQKDKLNSTLSVKDLAARNEPHSFREKSNDSIKEVQQRMNSLFEKFKQSRHL